MKSVKENKLRRFKRVLVRFEGFEFGFREGIDLKWGRSKLRGCVVVEWVENFK